MRIIHKFGNRDICFQTSFGESDGRSVFRSVSGPILLYTGNEGSIEAFWDANGFMTDVLAPQFGALLLFPEERYYGLSLPFGSDCSRQKTQNISRQNKFWRIS